MVAGRLAPGRSAEKESSRLAAFHHLKESALLYSPYWIDDAIFAPMNR